MKRIVVSAVAVLCVLVLRAAPVGAAFFGSITSQGYFPPPGVTVTWRIAGQSDVTKRLDPAVLFTSLGDVAGFLCRYAECDQTVVGRQIVPFVTSEHGGGEGFAILQELFRQSGLTRDPSLQEAYDWMIANGGGRALFTCSDFLQYTGHARPGCQDIEPGGGGGGSKLRLQPNDPPGCCPSTLPCTLRNEAGRKDGEEWTEPVQTPQGGRIGCRLRNVVVEGGPGEPPPEPGEPPPGTPPECPPVDGEACLAFTKPIRAALTTSQAQARACTDEKAVLTTRVQDLEQTLASRQTEITALKARVTELEGRRFDTLDTTRFTAALQGMNRPGQVTIRPRAAQEIQATTDFLRSLHQRQCLTVP